MFLFKKLNHDLLNYYKIFKMGEIVEKEHTKKKFGTHFKSGSFWYIQQDWANIGTYSTTRLDYLVHTTRLNHLWYMLQDWINLAHYKTTRYILQNWIYLDTLQDWITFDILQD